MNAQYTTKWSMLALLAAALGAGATVALDRAYLHRWASSGQRFSVARQHDVRLERGPVVLFYESKRSVGRQYLLVHIVDPAGAHVWMHRPPESENFRLLSSGWSGRAIASFEAGLDGIYSIGCYNHNYLADHAIPPTDRLVINKSPATVAEAWTVRRAIQVAGASTTIALVAVLYAKHLCGLRRRRGSVSATPRDLQTSAAGEPPSDDRLE